MLVHIQCKCRWFGLVKVDAKVQAELLAEQHESQDWRRPYRHETTVTTVREEV